MRSPKKSLTAWLIALLAVSIAAGFLPIASSAQINPQYVKTKSSDTPMDIKFSLNNNSALYMDSKSLNIKFTAGFGEFDGLSLGSALYSVSYKTSWQTEPIMVYRWSFNDPANLKDDDSNPQGSVSHTVDLKDAPVGNQQIQVTVTGGIYAMDFTHYWILTTNGSSILNFSVEAQTPVASPPTFNAESGILWATNLSWNLTGTPAETLWETDISGKYRDWVNPVIADGVVYAGATSTVGLARYGHPSVHWISVYAFNAKNGSELWNYQANFSGITGFAVSDGRVYFCAQGSGLDILGNQLLNESVTALDASTGRFLWSTPCQVFYAVPTAQNGRVYVNSGYSMLAIDGANGNIVWNYTAQAIITTPPIIFNNIVYVQPIDNNLYALGAEKGNLIWSHENDLEILFAGDVTAAGYDVLYASSPDGKIYAIDATSGNRIWGYDATPPEFSWVNYTAYTTPVYKDGKLYFTSMSDQHIHTEDGFCEMHDKNSVIALDAGNGHKLWNYTGQYSLYYDVAVAGRVVFFQEGASIIGLDSRNGAFIWNFTRPEQSIQTKLNIVNEVLYAGFGDGQLYALKIPNISQIDNQNTFFLNGNQNMYLLTIIVVVLAAALITLIVLFRSKHPKPISEK